MKKAREFAEQTGETKANERFTREETNDKE